MDVHTWSHESVKSATHTCAISYFTCKHITCVNNMANVIHPPPKMSPAPATHSFAHCAIVMFAKTYWMGVPFTVIDGWFLNPNVKHH